MCLKHAYLFAVMAFLFACSEDNTSKPILDVPFSEAATSSSSFVETQSFPTDVSSSSLEIISSAENVSSSSDTSLFASSSSEMSSATESSSSEWGPISYGELVDERDGRVYRTVKIGSQTWMAENLNYAYIQAYEHKDSTFKCENYDEIYWSMGLYKLDSLSFCYNNDLDSCKKYGRLYLWDAALNCGEEENKPVCEGMKKKSIHSHGICPEKWHIPSFNEWKTLSNYVSDSAKYLKTKMGWGDDTTGLDVLGFGVLPAGMYPFISYLTEYVYTSNYDFWGLDRDLIGQAACFWSTQQDGYKDYGGYQDYIDAYAFCFSHDNELIFSDLASKTLGLSVRCVMDSVASE